MPSISHAMAAIALPVDLTLFCEIALESNYFGRRKESNSLVVELVVVLLTVVRAKHQLDASSKVGGAA